LWYLSKHLSALNITVGKRSSQEKY